MSDDLLDLIERLRSLEMHATTALKLCREAADALTRLAAEKAELVEQARLREIDYWQERERAEQAEANWRDVDARYRKLIVEANEMLRRAEQAEARLAAVRKYLNRIYIQAGGILHVEREELLALLDGDAK